MGISKILLFVQKHPVITFLICMLLNLIVFILIFDNKEYKNISFQVLSNIGLIIIVDTLISAFINIEEWKTKDRMTYLKEQEAFLTFKFLEVVILFIAIYFSSFEIFKSKNMLSVIFYTVTFSILMSSILTSFSQFFSRLLLSRFHSNKKYKSN